MKKLVLLSMLLPIFLQAATFDITDFGAVPADKGLSTAAIQKAIDTCNQQGGGKVLVPEGEFLSGALVLKSNVNLHLETGAVLKGSSIITDYQINGVTYGLIHAREARNVSITGQGEINGNGTIFFNPDKPHVGQDFDRSFTRQGDKYMNFENGIEDGPIACDDRPHMLVVLLRCENVLIENVTFRDSPSWTFRIGDCDRVNVRGIKIDNNLLVPNSDGVHCTTSRNIHISDCDIRAGDDAIIVTGFGDEITVGGDDTKSDKDYPSRKIGNKTGYAENITVTNCTLQSRSSGIRVGYGENSIRNCTFSNLVIYESNRGIGVFARDAGSIENIFFSDIVIQTRLHTGHWWGHGEPIHVSAIGQNRDVPVGSIKNIHFNNIMAKSESGIVIYGEKQGVVSDISLQDIRFELVNGKHSLTFGGNFDLRPVASLEKGIFKHDIPGLFAGHVNGLNIDRFQLIWGKDMAGYFTDGIECENTTDLTIRGFTGSQSPASPTSSAIHLSQCQQVIIDDCMAAIGTTVFLSHENVGGLFVPDTNQLSNAQINFKPSLIK
jgi:hypothetical protein